MYNLMYSPSGAIWIKDLLCNQNQYFKGCSLDLVLITHLQDLDTDLHHDLQKGAFCIFLPQTKSQSETLVCIRQGVSYALKSENSMLLFRSTNTSDKCVYELPPFDPCFNPRKHNKYIKMKLQVERKTLIAQRAKSKWNLHLIALICLVSLIPEGIAYFGMAQFLTSFGRCLPMPTKVLVIFWSAN